MQNGLGPRTFLGWISPSDLSGALSADELCKEADSGAHGGLADFAFRRVSEAMLHDLRRTVPAGHGNVDKTYRIAVLIRLGSSDAGDGDHQIGLGPFNPALGHGFGNLPADGGMAGEQLTGDTQGCRLMDFAVNDEAAMQRVSGARSLGEKVNQCSGRAGLGCRQGERALLCHLHDPASIGLQIIRHVHLSGDLQERNCNGARSGLSSPIRGENRMETFSELFEETLKDIYYAEKAILKALPKMAKKASSKKLQAAFTKHQKETEGQVERLEQVFELLGKRAAGKKCPAIEGIIEEAEEVMKEAKDDTIRDAAMLAAAQAVEHYEISRYGTLVAWAEKMEMSDAAELLNATLEEEKATDGKLTELAESEINVEAEATDDEEQPKRRAAGGRRR